MGLWGLRARQNLIFLFFFQNRLWHLRIKYSVNFGQNQASWTFKNAYFVFLASGSIQVCHPQNLPKQKINTNPERLGVLTSHFDQIFSSWRDFSECKIKGTSQVRQRTLPKNPQVWLKNEQNWVFLQNGLDDLDDFNFHQRVTVWMAFYGLKIEGQWEGWLSV